MQHENEDGGWNVRALLESTKTPFSVASHQPRAVIFGQGEPCDTVMQIQTGRVWLAVSARSGQEAIVGLLGPGALLGEDALGGQAVRRQTATAMTATEVLVVAKAPLLRLLRSERTVSDRFVAHMVARTIRLEADLTDQLLNASEQRLARTLLLLAGCDGVRPQRRVLPDVSQEKIAEMVGTTRSRVNAFMVKFRKLGFIEDEGGVLQVNPALLLAVLDGEPGSSVGASPVLSQLASAEMSRWNRAGR